MRKCCPLCMDSTPVNKSNSQVAHLKMKLQNLPQGSKSCYEYLQIARYIWADQLAAVGKPLEDIEDLISSIISGLNPSLNTLITSFSFFYS